MRGQTMDGNVVARMAYGIRNEGDRLYFTHGTRQERHECFTMCYPTQPLYWFAIYAKMLTRKARSVSVLLAATMNYGYHKKSFECTFENNKCLQFYHLLEWASAELNSNRCVCSQNHSTSKTLHRHLFAIYYNQIFNNSAAILMQ